MSDPKHLDCPGCIGFSDEHTCPGQVLFEAMRKAKDGCHACATKNAKIERLRAALERIEQLDERMAPITNMVRAKEIAREALTGW